ncbi:hypothetical protein CI238_06248 [Colletotrichum incanum]|uniref:Uncharacterized protein n=1 Tax=Colletotrichum incanum TaxID=1573173 RepID=A0A166NUA0_COLIC|nr:hypothetical protein CI238_06248 [Colletotrichum incanum]
MGATCSSQSDCNMRKKDPTDADVMGIGVLLAFVIPVLLSHVIVYLAYVARMFDDDQYMEIDKRILGRLERQRSILASIRKTKYRQILLGLSDQLLVTSIGILVAIYVQICTMSLLCFNVGAELAFLASGVHMNCLVALGSYFEEHKRQARVRIYLMVFLLLFILVTNFFVYITWYNSERRTIACAIRHFKTDWPYLFVAWLALCWWVSAGFRKSINQLRDARSEFPRVHSLVHSILSIMYKSEESRRDLEAWNERETQKIRSKYRQKCRILRQRSPRPPWRITAPIIASAIVDDFWQSIIFITIWNLSYTVTGMYGLVGILVDARIDYKPLLEPKFGQILPLIMLLVLLFNIMEASGSLTETETQSKIRDKPSPRISTEASELTLLLPGRISRQNTNEWVAPPRRRATGFAGHRQTGVEVIVSGGLSRRQTGDTVREQRPPIDRQPAPIPEESEANGIRLPNRANTILMETGHVGETGIDKNLDNRFDLSAIVYEDTPRWVIKLAFLMAFTMTVLFFYLLVHYFNEMIIAMCALNLLYQFGHTCKGFWGFWKARRQRRRIQPV